MWLGAICIHVDCSLNLQQLQSSFSVTCHDSFREDILAHSSLQKCTYSLLFLDFQLVPDDWLDQSDEKDISFIFFISNQLRWALFVGSWSWSRNLPLCCLYILLKKCLVYFFIYCFILLYKVCLYHKVRRVSLHHDVPTSKLHF